MKCDGTLTDGVTRCSTVSRCRWQTTMTGGWRLSESSVTLVINSSIARCSASTNRRHRSAPLHTDTLHLPRRRAACQRVQQSM